MRVPNGGSLYAADIAHRDTNVSRGSYSVIPNATDAVHNPKQAAGKQTNKNAPQTKQNRHEQSEVPTPIKTLTHGGCLTGAPKARREFRRGYSKAIFDYFLAQQKVIAQVGGSPDTGTKPKNKTQKSALTEKHKKR